MLDGTGIGETYLDDWLDVYIKAEQKKAFSVSVSYTHLDVYKRQSEQDKPGYFNVSVSPLNDAKGASIYILQQKIKYYAQDSSKIIILKNNKEPTHTNCCHRNCNAKNHN